MNPGVADRSEKKTIGSKIAREACRGSMFGLLQDAEDVAFRKHGLVTCGGVCDHVGDCSSDHHRSRGPWSYIVTLIRIT